MSVRTLGRLVRKMELASKGSRATAESSARHDAVRRANNRVMACPEAHRLAIEAGEWMVKNAPRDANPMDYPEMVEKMTEVARVLDAHEARLATQA